MPSVRRLDEGPLRTGTRAKIRQPHIPEAEYVVTELEPGDRSPGSRSVQECSPPLHHDAEPPPDGGTRGAVGVPDRRASCGDGTFLPRTDPTATSPTRPKVSRPGANSSRCRIARGQLAAL